MLIAAGEAGDRQKRTRGLQVHARDVPVDVPRFLFGVNAGQMREAVEHRQGGVLVDDDNPGSFGLADGSLSNAE